MSVIQRLLTSTGQTNRNPVTIKPASRAVLVVTADVTFYSGALHAACAHQLRADWVRTLGRAIEQAANASIILYDADLPDVTWDLAFVLLNPPPEDRRLVLAARTVDEELWRSVLQHRGYDAVPRSAGSQELSRILRFACLSLRVKD